MIIFFIRHLVCHLYQIMIYDTTHRRVALLLHESEASSAMIADITRQLLEKRGFRVRMVKVEAEDNDDGGGAGGMVKQACSLVSLSTHHVRQKKQNTCVSLIKHQVILHL